MWTTNYEWFGILSSISDPYCPFYDSTYLFDCCYYPLMTICVISLSWQCTRENGTLYQYLSFLIQWASFGLLIKTVILLRLHSTPFALWTSPQWNRICEWSVIDLSTTNKRIISLSLTCQRNTTCNLYCFQNNTQISYSNIFPLFLGYNHPTKSTSFNRVSKTIMHWYHHHITYLQLESHHGTFLFISSTLTSCSRSIWSATHSFKHTPIHNHWSIHLHLLFLPLFAIHGSNNTCCNSTHTVDSWHS